jgi:hypothetical protein
MSATQQMIRTNFLNLIFFFLLGVVINAKNTVVIIYGQYRTFDVTCPTIVKNIIEPNGPNVTIVLSLDHPKPFHFPTLGSICLEPWLEHVHILDGLGKDNKHYRGHPIEFLLQTRALKYTKSLPIQFDYAIKIRFDNAVNVAFPPLATLYQPSSKLNYYHHFREKLKHTFPEKYGNNKANCSEEAWAWIAASGSAHFLPFLENNGGSPWSMFATDVYSAKLREYLFSNRTHRSNCIELVEETMELLHPLYLFGSTWLHYGPYDQVYQTTFSALNDFFTLNFKRYGYSGFLACENITETALRLSHFVQDIPLFDIVNHFDYEASFPSVDFPSNQTLARHFANPDNLVWLVRLCNKDPFRRDCMFDQYIGYPKKKTASRKPKEQFFALEAADYSMYLAFVCMMVSGAIIYWLRPNFLGMVKDRCGWASHHCRNFVFVPRR